MKEHLDQGMEEVSRKIGGFLEQGVRAITFDCLFTVNIWTWWPGWASEQFLRHPACRLRRLGLERRGASSTPGSLRTPPGPPPCRSLLFACGSASRVLHQQANRLVSQGGCGEVSIGPESLTDANQWKTLKKAAREAWAKGDLLIRISPKPASPPHVDVDTG